MKNREPIDLACQMEEIAVNYDETDYCECGCKNRKDYGHGNVGKHRFEKFMQSITSEEAIELAREIIGSHIDRGWKR